MMMDKPRIIGKMYKLFHFDTGGDVGFTAVVVDDFVVSSKTEMHIIILLFI